MWVGLADGGGGPDEFLRVYSPRAEPVLDVCHAAEHPNELARALRPGGDEAARESAGRWRHPLKREGGAAVPAALEGVDQRGRKGGAPKGAGMRWGGPGADAACHLRAPFQSETGQSDAFRARAP